MAEQTPQALNSRRFPLRAVALTTVLGLILLPLAALAWLLASEAGAVWLIRNLSLHHDQIYVANTQGRLLDRLILRQIEYRDGDFVVTVDKATLQWTPAELFAGHVHIGLLQVDEINIEGEPPASSDQKTEPPSIPTIPVKITVGRLAINRIVLARQPDPVRIDAISASAQLSDNTVSVRELMVKMPQIEVNTTGTVQLQPDWPLTVELTWNVQSTEAALQGQAKIEGNLAQLNFSSDITGDIQAQQRGTLSLANDEPEFDIEGAWQHLAWPLQGASEVSSDSGTFSLNGTANQYQTELAAQLHLAAGQTIALTFSGQGNPQQFDIASLTAKPPKGQLNMTGLINWADATRFDLALNAQKINPADWGSPVAGLLQATVKLSGAIEQEQLQADLLLESIRGQLQDQPLSAGGRIHVAGRQLEIADLKILAGQNRLTASGTLDEKRGDLHLLVDAPNLKTAWPLLGGQLRGKATVAGTWNQPVVTADFNASELTYGDIQLASAGLETSYAHASGKPSAIDLQVNNLQFGKEKLAQLQLQGRGNVARHRVSLSADSSLADIELNVQGAWNKGQWRGAIERLEVDQPQLKRWQLEAPAQLSVKPVNGSYRIDLERSCLRQDAAHLCVAAKGSANSRLQGQLDISAWPLATIQPWLPPALELTGLVSAQAEGTFGPGKTRLDGRLEIEDGKALFNDHGTSHELPLSEAGVLVNYQNDTLESQLRLAIGPNDYVNGHLQAVKTAAADSYELSGDIKAHIAEMQFIDSLIEAIEDLQGVVTADLAVSGSSKQPVISGTAQWQQGQLNIPALGTTWQAVNLTANSDPERAERLNIQANVVSGDGQLTGGGYVDLLPENDFPMELALRGQQFQLSRLPEAEIDVSPDLAITRAGNLTQVSGKLHIDQAKLVVETLPENAVKPSEDQVLVNDQAESPEPATGTPPQTEIKIAIDFGQQSYFEGFGLKTHLDGNLSYLANSNRTSLRGRTAMRDATYRAYGQDLTIRKGEFLFDGPPDNPWMNVEAIRKAQKEDVTAVINVTGPLKSPQTQVYSEPPLPESEALSYLVTGKSMKQLGKSESGSLATAAFNYGFGQLSWLSDQLGIDEFEFESGDTIEESAVKLGQYLNPDLYVGVQMGLFANKYNANVRYRLTDHINVETQAGETQRLEINYHLETE